MRTIYSIILLISFLKFTFSKRREKEQNQAHLLFIDPINISINAFIFIGIFLLMNANKYSGDTISFVRFYDYLKITGSNPFDYTYELFAYTVKLFLMFYPKASYYIFRALLIAILWVILILHYKKYISNYGSFAFLYLSTFSFAHDGSQIKNFVSVCVLLCGILYINSGKIKNLIIYYCFCLIATIFHFSFLIYTILPMIKTKVFRKIKIFIPLIGGFIYWVFFIVGNKGYLNIIIKISSIFMMSKIAKYSEAYSGKRSIVFFAIYFLILSIIMRLEKNISNLNSDEVYILNLASDIWYLMGVVIPSLIIVNAAWRLLRNFLIIIFIVISNSVISEKIFSKNRNIAAFYAFLVIGSLLMQIFIFKQGIDVFIPIFSGGFFWNY